MSSLLAYCVGLLLDQQEELLLASFVNDDDDSTAEEPLNGDLGDAEQGSITARERILAATSSLDLGDYCGLAFSSVLLLVVLCLGYFVFHKFERLSPIDALYATIISASTVGFGDYEPTHPPTKLFMTFWLLFSTLAVAKVVADFTDATAKRKQRDVTRRLLTARVTKDGLRLMDTDRNGSVDKCEFLTEMLARTGKVEREEIDTILLRFKELDKDSSGNISTADL